MNLTAHNDVLLQKLRKQYSTKKEADSVFLDLYNSGLYLPKAYNFIGSISIGTLHRWVKVFEQHESTECLQPKYKWSKQGEYNSILNDEMKNILLTLLLHPSKYNYGKAIKLTKEILRKRGYEALPCDLTFKRYAENFRKNNYAEWILRREGMKAYHDKVEPCIERDLSKIEVGDILVADGHVLNFQVINPFTGKPTRATLVGFLDWKSTALVGYEIMMTESTQCIASALRNAIINLGMIPKVVYQDNGKGFKAKFFQDCDFDEDIFNGVYANLNIHSVFAKPYNARAKVIERFFLEFQEELEKGIYGLGVTLVAPEKKQISVEIQSVSFIPDKENEIFYFTLSGSEKVLRPSIGESVENYSVDFFDREGQKIEKTCAISYCITKDGRPVKGISIDENGKLTVTAEAEEGEYRLEAKNSEGESTYLLITLKKSWTETQKTENGYDASMVLPDEVVKVVDDTSVWMNAGYLVTGRVLAVVSVVAFLIYYIYKHKKNKEAFRKEFFGEEE